MWLGIVGYGACIVVLWVGGFFVVFVGFWLVLVGVYKSCCESCVRVCFFDSFFIWCVCTFFLFLLIFGVFLLVWWFAGWFWLFVFGHWTFCPVGGQRFYIVITLSLC